MGVPKPKESVGRNDILLLQSEAEETNSTRDSEYHVLFQRPKAARPRQLFGENDFGRVGEIGDNRGRQLPKYPACA